MFSGKFAKSPEGTLRVEVVSRGKKLSFYRAWYGLVFPGEPGEPYMLILTNMGVYPIVVVVTADGYDVSTNELGTTHNAGIVIPAGGTTTVTGWKSAGKEETGLAFNNLRLSEEACSDPNNYVGTIGFAIRPKPQKHEVALGEFGLNGLRYMDLFTSTETSADNESDLEVLALGYMSWSMLVSQGLARPNPNPFPGRDRLELPLD